jgi:hypothetical protein
LPDLEGHLGHDNKYYLLDFSRVFPPEAPITTVKNAHLSRLLRPEFVVSYRYIFDLLSKPWFSEPLCSDAFSGFIRGHHEKPNAAVVEATTYLLKTLVQVNAYFSNVVSDT